MRDKDDHALVVSSPPFPQPYSAGGGLNVRGYGPDGKDKVGDRTYQSKGGDRAEGNLETLETGSVELVVSSPPFVNSLGNKPSAGLLAGSGGRMGASQKTEEVYGET